MPRQPGKRRPHELRGRFRAGIVFSWIVYKSRAQRDRINLKVMSDPRLAPMMKPGAMPFDVKRMAYGGFKVLVQF